MYDSVHKWVSVSEVGELVADEDGERWSFFTAVSEKVI
jgi:hypothetical protein